MVKGKLKTGKHTLTYLIFGSLSMSLIFKYQLFSPKQMLFVNISFPHTQKNQELLSLDKTTNNVHEV